MDTRRSIKALTTRQALGQPSAMHERSADREQRGSVAGDADQPTTLDLPELWGHGSFPASDPPANW